ncbi:MULTISPECIES: hypothetical protein [unclassified Clostridium]|jgi:hypothetical protein|uniref:hypothetical protein n=1 Tax=unclassified Clostridium TaxID=2614128 RepID=UPI0025BC0632|nr:hypothetical protein [Clostridium sp.]MCI6691487.1 hypothetical protein [Clostridium sp.]MDY2632177.1 hypothetical protein [Clostridium sp.]MDY4251132.1 hypothetical protein [Clostridium sp.]MDY6229215.1 hypothetical protein [Clostridium sp.]
MKKVIIYIFTIILGASIPIYFLLIWEPLKSKEVLSNEIFSEDINENNTLNKNKDFINDSVEVETVSLKQSISNSLFNYLDNERKEKLNVIMKKLSILDLIKINDFFIDKDNKEQIKKGVELAKKRMSSSDYEIFKDILENSINSIILD